MWIVYMQEALLSNDHEFSQKCPLETILQLKMYDTTGERNTQVAEKMEKENLSKWISVYARTVSHAYVCQFSVENFDNNFRMEPDR